jgi:hypothetical protein
MGSTVILAVASSMSIREQLQAAALQSAEQETQIYIKQAELQYALQKVQQNAVIIDNLLTALDEGNAVDPLQIPQIPKEFTQAFLPYHYHEDITIVNKSL